MVRDNRLVACIEKSDPILKRTRIDSQKTTALCRVALTVAEPGDQRSRYTACLPADFGFVPGKCSPEPARLRWLRLRKTSAAIAYTTPFPMNWSAPDSFPSFEMASIFQPSRWFATLCNDFHM